MKLSERLRKRLDETEKAIKIFGLNINNLSADHEYFILSECLKVVSAVENAKLRLSVYRKQPWNPGDDGESEYHFSGKIPPGKYAIVSLEDTP